MKAIHHRYSYTVLLLVGRIWLKTGLVNTKRLLSLEHSRTLFGRIQMYLFCSTTRECRWQELKPKGQRTGTLEIGEDDKGFWGLADVNLQRSDVNNAYLALQDGDIRETSFAFRARRQEWNEDYTVRRVLEVEMNRGDLSLVTHGANPYGSAEARSAQCAQCRSLDKPAEAATIDVEMVDLNLRLTKALGAQG